VIGKQDILDRAAEWQLRPEIVEKDYVLGWLLAALGAEAVSSVSWVFKGGTCLKKCFFETYRFSEDLDFSLLPEATYTEGALRKVLQAAGRRAHELSGVEFPEDLVVVRPRQDKLGRATFEGRIAYRGPLGVPTWPRVLFDLTQHEPVLAPATRRSIFHPYPDGPLTDARVRTYTLEELFAEKTRALLERTRPRDLYDVVYLLENQPETIDLDGARGFFRMKCAAKGIAAPSAARLVEHIRASAELRSEWSNMLAHQLPALPPVESMLGRLPELLHWIEAPVVLPGARLAAVPMEDGEQVVATPSAHFWGGGVPLEAVRFAGANRLLIEFTYDGRRRRVEPYSLRRASTGNLLLYAWEHGAGHIKAFNVVKIHDIQTTDVAFAPRYRIELTASGAVTKG
jgi:predicted nucleotidyltransferase component of viral defense system